MLIMILLTTDYRKNHSNSCDNYRYRESIIAYRVFRNLILMPEFYNPITISLIWYIVISAASSNSTVYLIDSNIYIILQILQLKTLCANFKINLVQNYERKR